MSDTQLIKDKLDIVDLISEYVQLKPAGVNHKGLCPFHGEKTPSFMASRERQSWHCFGCGKGGDIFSFVQEIEGMEFIEALKLLASRAGVQITQRENDISASQKNRIKEINSQAAGFWHNFLLRMPVSAPALAYLKQRGLTSDTIEAWRIGFAPDQWELLTQYLLKKGHSIDDLVASGITIQRRDGEGMPVVHSPAMRGGGRGFYDRFRGRIMFPIWDVHGTVVGFTGRVLVETENSGGKYVNTPQTLAYDKSRVVFGLDKAKQDIRSKNEIVMVEGQMDVIACHQAGMRNVVAASGTALTVQQVQLLKRYANNLLISFDADSAGQAAAKRGIDVALEAGMNVKIIRIPDGAGKDPDECLKKNPSAWFEAVKQAEDIMHWYFAKAFDGKNIADPKAKQRAANELLPEIGRIPFAVEQDHWLRELGSRLAVDVGVLLEDLARIKNKEETRNWKPETKGSLKADNSFGGVAKKTRMEVLVERYFALILKFPKLFPVSSFQFLTDKLSTPSLNALYEAIKSSYTKSDVLFQSGLPEPANLLIMQGDLLFAGMSDKEARNEFGVLNSQIREEWLHQQRSKLQQEMAQIEKTGDTVKMRELLERWQKLAGGN